MSPSVLVTGASGMIGTALCQRLLLEHIPFWGMDIVPSRWDEKIDRFIVRTDLRRAPLPEPLDAETQTIVHLAANAMVYPSVVNPLLARDNEEMTFNMLEYCRKNDISSFILASSREVYGNTGLAALGEDEVNLSRCESPYAASKISGEAWVHAYRRCYGINATILRFSNVYGKYDFSRRLMPSIIRQIKEGKPVSVYGKNKQLSFTYIEDTVEGILLALNHTRKKGGDTFNIANPASAGIEEVVHLLYREMGIAPNITMCPPRAGEVIQFKPDISKATRQLGFVPRVGIEEGIKKTIEWYAHNRPVEVKTTVLS